MDVTLREYDFAVSGPVPAGRVVFRVVNAGHEGHAPMLVALDDTYPPIEEAVRGPERPPWTALGGVNTREPGTAGSFAVDLQPGQRYAIVCREITSEGVSHAAVGMVWEFETEGAGG